MLEFATIAAFALASVSFLTSVVSVAIHYAKRHENPVLGPIEAELAAVKLQQVDVIDRLEHFMKRDRTRRVREAATPDAPEQLEVIPAPGITSTPDKATLRAVARQKGYRV
jgi:hypothetical protein